MTRTGSGSVYSPVPRYACVSMPEGLTKAMSKSPRATACARAGDPGAIRSAGVNASPEPLPMTMETSRSS